MRQPRARSAARQSLVALAVIASAIGCASPHPRPIQPGEVLRPDEGLLVLHLRTERPLRSLAISGSSFPLEVGTGTHLLLIAVSAGSYRWSALGTPSNAEDPESETVELLFPYGAEFRFRIEAGRINYAGMLEVGYVDWGVGVRSVERTALALEEIRSRFPKLLEQYPIVYSGAVRDVFLERYLAAQSARKTAGVSETAR